MSTIEEQALNAVSTWYEHCPRPRSGGGLPSKGTLAVGLVILERLKENYDLDLQSHMASGGAQIQGASGAAVRKILRAFGEERPFVSEGGRTNRGTPAIAKALLDALEPLDFDQLDERDRTDFLLRMQAWLVERVKDFHKQARIKPIYSPAQSTRQFVAEILLLARETGKHGPVAQYLVGAKLKLRFPNVDVRNEHYSAADDSTGQPGDFVIGDTAFHVTVAPSPGHYEKCRKNLEEGRRVFLLVPDTMLVGARQNAEHTASGKIAVESIESFVGQNIEELATFASGGVASGLRELISVYNERIDEVEIDKSMMIELPRNLAETGDPQ